MLDPSALPYRYRDITPRGIAYLHRLLTNWPAQLNELDFDWLCCEVGDPRYLGVALFATQGDNGEVAPPDSMYGVLMPDLEEAYDMLRRHAFLDEVGGQWFVAEHDPPDGFPEIGSKDAGTHAFCRLGEASRSWIRRVFVEPDLCPHAALYGAAAFLLQEDDRPFNGSNLGRLLSFDEVTTAHVLHALDKAGLIFADEHDEAATRW